MHRRALILAALALLGCAGVPPGRAEWSVASQPEVPLEGNGHGWLVRATVNGQAHGVFLLDSGASYCVLSRAFMSRLGLPASGARVSIQTANGVVQAPLVRLSLVDVAGNRARDVNAIVHDAVAAPIDGIIGLSFLNQFTYAVDPRRKVLRLR